VAAKPVQIVADEIAGTKMLVCGWNLNKGGDIKRPGEQLSGGGTHEK